MNKIFYLSPVFILVLSLLSVSSASAQSSDISPYSRYGIGDLQDQNSALNFSMGGTGIAYHNDLSMPFFVNLKNPASYAYSYVPIEDSSGTGGLKMAAFDAGITDNILNLSTQGETTNSNNAYLAYIAMNVAVNRHVGIAMGLTPVSTEGYNITTTSNVDSNNVPGHALTSVQTNYLGSGGINKAFLGIAVSPIKNLSIGANLNYLFGNLGNEESISFSNGSAFNTFKVENVGIHSFSADFGIMYTLQLGDDWNITLGGTFTPSLTITSGYNIISLSQNPNTGLNVDTLQDSSSNGKIRMPMAYGYGITIKKGDQWTFSFDNTVQNWSQYSYFGQTENLINSYTYGIGMQYVPEKNGLKSYLQRVHYRLGFSYSQNYLDLYNTPLIDKSVSAGIGLPIGSSKQLRPSVLNIAIRVGNMGTTTNSLIRENYVKLMFGFTFDDHWFEKRKFQ